MMTNNFALYGVKIFGELGRDILFFPLWWYSLGLIQTGKGLLNFLADREKAMALLVWIKNLHRPMYGQYDWQGFLISFFMRLVVIIFKSLIMLFWLFLCFVVLVAWLAMPFYIGYQIIFQLNG